MKIEYTKVGDYYLPNLYYPEETRPIGLWGMLRKEYLKEHKSGTYTYLLLTARLDSYLADLNEQAQERFELIETQMRSAEGVSEELKRQNPMEWLNTVHILHGLPYSHKNNRHSNRYCRCLPLRHGETGTIFPYHTSDAYGKVLLPHLY